MPYRVPAPAASSTAVTGSGFRHANIVHLPDSVTMSAPPGRDGLEAPERACTPLTRRLPIPKLADLRVPARRGVLRRRGAGADPDRQRDRPAERGTGQADHRRPVHVRCIASIIQAVGFWKVGVRLPLLQGVTFTGVSP